MIWMIDLFIPICKGSNCKITWKFDCQHKKSYLVLDNINQMNIQPNWNILCWVDEICRQRTVKQLKHASLHTAYNELQWYRNLKMSWM